METLGPLARSPLLIAVACAVAIGVLVAWRLAPRRPAGTALVEWVGFFASFGLILGAVLFRYGIPTTFSLATLTEWPTDQMSQLVSDPFSSDQILLNVALFVPAGFFLARLTDRPVISLLVLTGSSLTLEVLQAVLGIGANDVSDVVANAVGAGLGTVSGAGLRWARPRPAGARPGARPGARHMAAWAGSLVALSTAIVIAANVTATHRADRLRAELATRFEGTTLADYRRWEAVETVSEIVFDAVTPRADGVQNGADMVSVRYPASFLGARRCVVVAWAPGEVVTRRTSGGECTRFLG